MKEANQSQSSGDAAKASEQMKRAVDRTIEAERRKGHFGNDQGKQDAARDLKTNAEKDTGKKSS